MQLKRLITNNWLYYYCSLKRYPKNSLQQCNNWEPCTHARSHNNAESVWAQSKPVWRVVLRPITHITLCKGSSVVRWGEGGGECLQCINVSQWRISVFINIDSNKVYDIICVVDITLFSWSFKRFLHQRLFVDDRNIILYLNSA